MGKGDTSDVLWTRDGIEETERRVREATAAAHPDAIRLFEDVEQAYLVAFSQTVIKRTASYAPNVFFAKSFQTFRSAVWLCMSGYYSQAGGLARFLLEEALLIDYYRRHPSEALDFLIGPNWEQLQSLFRKLEEAVLEEGDDTTNRILDELECEIRYERAPMASEISRRLKKRLASKKLRRAKEVLDKIQMEFNKDRIPPIQQLVSSLGLSRAQQGPLRRRYEALCHFVHSRRDPTLRSVVDRPDKLTLVVGPKYDLRAFQMVAETIVGAGHFALTTWTFCVPALFGDSSWLSTLKELGVRVLELELSMQELGLIPNAHDLLDAYRPLMGPVE